MLENMEGVFHEIIGKTSVEMALCIAILYVMRKGEFVACKSSLFVEIPQSNSYFNLSTHTLESWHAS